MNDISKFLEANPDYGGLQQIVIDFNVVEVNDGWFFLIPKKEFTKDWYNAEEYGLVTPRRHMNYSYTPGVVPYPKE